MKLWSTLQVQICSHRIKVYDVRLAAKVITDVPMISNARIILLQNRIKILVILLSNVMHCLPSAYAHAQPKFYKFIC
jgi:hypothetical protein